MTATITTAADTLAELEDRVRGGDTSVTATALAKARSDVELARLRGEADEIAKVQAIEDARVARIREIYDSIHDGELNRMAAAVLAAYNETATAAAELHRLASELDTRIRTADRELLTLGEIPADVDLDLGRVSAHRRHTAPQIRTGGTLVGVPDGRPDRLVAYAVRDAGNRSRIAEAATSSASDPIDSVRRIAELTETAP